MTTVSPVLWTHKTSPKGHHPIRLRFADASRSLYASLGAYVHPRHWNDRAERVRKTHDLHEEINELIETKLNAAERERLRTASEIPTAEALKAAVVGKGHTDCFRRPVRAPAPAPLSGRARPLIWSENEVHLRRTSPSL